MEEFCHGYAIVFVALCANNRIEVIFLHYSLELRNSPSLFRLCYLIVSFYYFPHYHIWISTHKHPPNECNLARVPQEPNGWDACRLTSLSQVTPRNGPIESHNKYPYLQRYLSSPRLRALSSGGSVTSPPPSPAMPKYKLAEYRYGREEMLALYIKDNKVSGKTVRGSVILTLSIHWWQMWSSTFLTQVV